MIVYLSPLVPAKVRPGWRHTWVAFLAAEDVREAEALAERLHLGPSRRVRVNVDGGDVIEYRLNGHEWNQAQRRGAVVLSAEAWIDFVHRLAWGPPVAVDGKSRGAGEL